MTTPTPQYLRELADNLGALCTPVLCDEAAASLRALADERERAVGGITDEVVRRAVRVHDIEDAAQKGEPDPWDEEFPEPYYSERTTAMRLALESAATALQPTEKLREELSELLNREWQKILRPVLLKRIGLYLDEVKAHAAKAAQAQAQSGEWVMVPREPTPEMLDAASIGPKNYASMLACAPQQAAEPVAWMVGNSDQGPFDFRRNAPKHPWNYQVPLYTHPPAQQDAEGKWQPIETMPLPAPPNAGNQR